MGKRVLIAPLDWGLGHATRCIPIIKLLLAKNFDIILGGSGQSIQLLKDEFPSLKCIALPEYNPKYSISTSMIWKMLIQLPKFIKAILSEHKILEDSIDLYKIDFIISDNRFGCWSFRVPCFFITHQINIKMPEGFSFLEIMVNKFNHRQIKKFNACLVPDNGDHKLSGELTVTNKPNVYYLGLLSQFESLDSSERNLDLLVLLSGPEPQRTLVENILRAQLDGTDFKVVMIRGVSGNGREIINDHFEILDFLSGSELQQIIIKSEIVIARSGYSTIMDLVKLKKKAIFLPTPGQTEQEYLASRLKDEHVAYSEDQDKFNLERALKKSKAFKGFVDFNFDESLLSNVIDELLVEVKK